MLSAKHFIDLEYNWKRKVQEKSYPIPQIGDIIELTEIGYTTRGDLKMEHPKGIVYVEGHTSYTVVCRQMYKNGSFRTSYTKNDFRKGLLTFNVLDEKKDHSQMAAVSQ